MADPGQPSKLALPVASPRRSRFLRAVLWLGVAVSLARVGALWYAFALVRKYELPDEVALPQWLWYPEALLLPPSFAWTLGWTAAFSGALLVGSFAIALVLAAIGRMGSAFGPNSNS